MATSSRGTTLFEMMITLLMVAILATVGYPSFSQYLRNSRRAQAQTDLLTLQLRLEEYRLNHSGESPTLAALGADLSTHYDYQLQVTAQYYKLTATARPQSSQQQDTSCTTLMLDQWRQRNPATCW